MAECGKVRISPTFEGLERKDKMKLFASGKRETPRLKQDTYARDLRKNWQLYVMVLLPIIYILVFAYGPMYGIQLAFKRYSPRYGIWGSEWVGLFYFKKLLRTPSFQRIFMNTLRLAVYSIIASFPVPILLALCMNTMTNKYYKKTVQMVTYLPNFISNVVIISMIAGLFNSQVGLIGRFLLRVSNGQIKNLLASPAVFPHIYVWSGVWQSAGWSTIIYMATLSGVSGEQTEAAIIDGATRRQRVWYIDIPALIPVVTINFIMALGGILNVGMEKALLLQNGFNLSRSEVIATYSYKVGLLNGSGDFSYGTAIGLFNSVINFAVLLTVNGIARRVSETSLW